MQKEKKDISLKRTGELEKRSESTDLWSPPPILCRYIHYTIFQMKGEFLHFSDFQNKQKNRQGKAILFI